MLRKFLIIIIILAAGCNVFALDLTLEQSIELSVANNPSIGLFEEKVREADYLVSQARSTFFPTITGQASYTRLDQVPYISFPPEMFEGLPPEMSELFPDNIEMGKKDNYIAKLTLQQPLFTGFKLLNGYGISRLNRESERLSYDLAVNQITYYTKLGYYNMLKAKHFMEIAEQSLKQMRAHLEDLEYMFEEGLLPKNDLLKAKVQLSRIQQMEQQAQHASKLAQASLTLLIGIESDDELHLVDSLHIQNFPYSQDEVLNMAYNNRLEFQQLELTEKMASKNITIKSMDFFPNLVFIYNYNYQKPDREIQDEWYDSWDATIAMQWNIWDWTRSIYKVKEAKSQKRQVQYSREILENKITLDVINAYLALDGAKISVEITEEEVEQAQENYRVTKEKFSEGMATNTELLDAQSDLTRAKFDRLNSMADYNISLAELVYYTGLSEKTK